MRRRPHIHYRNYRSGKIRLINPGVPKIKRLRIKRARRLIRKIPQEVIIDSAKDFIISKINNENYNIQASIAQNLLRYTVIIYIRTQFGIDSRTAELFADMALKSMSKSKI